MNYLRDLYNRYLHNHDNITIYTRPTKSYVRRFLNKWSTKFQNLFFGLIFLFSLPRYLVFSGIGGLVLSDEGKNFNRISGVLLSLLGSKALEIENSGKRSHYSIKSRAFRRTMSIDFFDVLSMLPMFTEQLHYKNERILFEIYKKYGIFTDHRRHHAHFIRLTNFSRFILRILRPRAIFMEEAYHRIHQPILFAANKLQIPTIELQHGMINSLHDAYNLFTTLDSHFYPDYLFCYGTEELNIFTFDNLLPTNFIPMGNSYLEYMADYQLSNDYQQCFVYWRQQYKKIVGVTTQPIVEDKLIPFLNKAIKLTPDILYVFIPRGFTKKYTFTSSNIVVFPELNFYQVIKLVDIHATVYSTCALEAPVLGIPNIMIDINNHARLTFETTLSNLDVTRFVSTEKEFVDTILTWDYPSSQIIKQAVSNFSCRNYKDNIETFLKNIPI